MIVRILDDAQYEVDDATVGRLDTLDAELEAALQKGDEARFAKALSAIVSEVQAHGHRLDETALVPSDLTLPHVGATIDEVKKLLASDEN